MNRKRWIAWASVIVGGCAVAAPASSTAHSTLLSGYGGPGAGEQMIIGSMLLQRGHHGSGGSNRAGAGSAAGSSNESLAVPTAGGSASSGSGGGPGAAVPGGNGASGAEADRPGDGHAASRQSAGSPTGGASKTYVYPSALRSTSASQMLGLSGGDLLLIGAILAGLGALGALTIRVARLKR